MSEESGRGVYRIIARREFVERARDRGFIISTLLTIFVLSAFIVVNALFNRETRFELGVVGGSARATGEQVAATAKALGFTVTLRDYSTEAGATQAVRDGAVAAALVNDERVVVKSSNGPGQLVAVIQAVSNRTRAQQALAASGLSQDAIDRALNVPPLPVHALEPVDPQRTQNSAIAIVGILALYGQLFAYGYWVAAGVVEEKASRVVEVLLSTIRPSQLLRGKILGIGLLGLCQLVLIGVTGVAVSRAAGILRVPSGALLTVGVVLLWFVLGFAFYAGLFAVAGAIVPRQEDLQTSMTPLSLLIVVSFFLGLEAVQTPTSTLAAVASMLPPSAPLTMPSRMILGQAPLWQGLLSGAILIGSTALLLPLATRAYSRAVLRAGRVRVREALRAERRG